MKQVCTLVAGLALASPALAQAWSDNFDSYPLGSLNGPNNWGPLFGQSYRVGEVSNTVALSGSNSLAINYPDDVVNDFTDATSGTWTLDADVYIPSGFYGSQELSILGEYIAGPVYHAYPSVRLAFIAPAGTVRDVRGGKAYFYVTDAWSHIRVNLDLTNRVYASFYNGNLLYTGTLLTPPVAPPFAAALRLHSYGSTVYYDNITFVPTPASCSLLGLGALAGLRRRRA